jgi:uncharacterized DUF497 family protein
VQPSRFEFDPVKSTANLAKHGIGFTSAERLWDDPDLLVLPSNFPFEPRMLAIGVLEGKHWTAVFTERAGRIRIISVRRSRHEEWKIYEKEKASHDR